MEWKEIASIKAARQASDSCSNPQHRPKHHKDSCSHSDGLKAAVAAKATDTANATATNTATVPAAAAATAAAPITVTATTTVESGCSRLQ